MSHRDRAKACLLPSSRISPAVIPGNHHFDTTRANIEVTGAEAVDLPCHEAADASLSAPFKGNIDLARLESLLQQRSQQVPMCIITLTDNTGGGQPVSLSNLRDARTLLSQHGIPLILDAAAEGGGPRRRLISLASASALKNVVLSSPLSSRARRSLPLRRLSTPSAQRRPATGLLRRGSPRR